MLKRMMGGFVLMAVFSLAGCATTGRNYQTDIDALNAKVAALQGQLAAKDQEINDQRMAREAAEASMHNSDSERQRMASQLDDLKSQSYKAKAPASDLK